MNDSNSLISHNKPWNTFMLINRWTIFEFPLYFAESKKKKMEERKRRKSKFTSMSRSYLEIERWERMINHDLCRSRNFPEYYLVIGLWAEVQKFMCLTLTLDNYLRILKSKYYRKTNFNCQMIISVYLRWNTK